MQHTLKTPLVKALKWCFVICFILISSGCHHDKVDDFLSADTNSSAKFTPVAKSYHSQKNQNIAKGMMAIVEGNLQEASTIFNSLLLTDQANDSLHAINAFVYHLMASQGDISRYSIAKRGYEKALKRNPQNVFALLQLGRIELAQRNYTVAQEKFAKVLTLEPSNVSALYEISVASYHMGDIKNAQVMVKRLISLDNKQAKHLRAAALISAANGDMNASSVYLTQYKQITNAQQPYIHLSKRVQEWKQAHNRGVLINISDAHSDEDDEGDADSGSEDSSDDEGDEEDSTDESGDGSEDEEEEDDPDALKITSKQMVVIDAVLMNIKDSKAASKGINILNALKTSLDLTRVVNWSDSGDTTNGLTKNFGIGLVGEGGEPGSISYALNIANSNKRHVHILGKPTLTTLVGKKAKFFTGSQKFISSSGSEVSSFVDSPIGTTVYVTPISVEDDYVFLAIEILSSRILSDIKTVERQNNQASFETTKNQIRTTVKVKFGETLMLAGIHEHESDSVDDGVPFLQKIPLIQYFFNREHAKNVRNSLMFLITPRNPEQNVEDAKKMVEEAKKRPNLAELKAKHPHWYSHVSNTSLILRNFKEMFDEFRVGDLDTTNWGDRENLKRELRELNNFIWY